MTSLVDVRPGDIIFGPIGGGVGAGIGAAQLLLAAAEPGAIWEQGWREWFGVRHVLVVVQSGTIVPGDTAPRAVQAMPRGAEEIPLHMDRHWTPDYVYVRPAYGRPNRLEGLQRLSAADQGIRVGMAARRYVGTPYNFATYAAIPAHRMHLPVPRLDAFISSRRDMMCSQLADQCLADAGWHCFDDGRLPQDVTPSELYRRLVTMPGSHLRPVAPGTGTAIWHPNILPR